MPDARSPQARSDSLVQLARHRTVYDIALAFYGVLTALALDHPLTKFAEGVAAAPWGRGFNDWTQRLLTLTLLVLAAIWIHTLAISLELNDTRRDPRLYRAAICLFWAGVAMVVILMILGRSVNHGTTAFLTASMAYLVWNLLFSIVGWIVTERPPKNAGRTPQTHVGVNPVRLVQALWNQRGDWQTGSQPNQSTRHMTAAFDVLQCVIGLIILWGLTWWGHHHTRPVWQFALALAWLLLVLLSASLDYLIQRWFYGL
ncbi:MULTISPECIES: hypothetical protein [unclassified Streptomyces]|uniref:hypothetical protein n=1 Tax=unclassified Streptomyces TaxID=2593676 RepID=UPI00336A94CA